MTTAIKVGDYVQFTRDWRTFDSPAAPCARRGDVVEVVGLDGDRGVMVPLASPALPGEGPFRQLVPITAVQPVAAGDVEGVREFQQAGMQARGVWRAARQAG